MQLTEENRCKLFGQSERPEICIRLRPNQEMCGNNMEDAMAYLSELEILTLPD